jgi:tetratricopeptide (TPR) repeat protein
MTASMIEEGWAALQAGDAATARDAFERALEQAESGAAREGLGQVLYLQRDYSGAIAQQERAYAAYLKDAEAFAAGRAARILAWITGNVLGDWAVQNGWLARALRILEEVGDDGPEHGWLLIIKSYTEPDAVVREALFREAIAVGRRFADPNLRSRPWPLSAVSISCLTELTKAWRSWMSRWPCCVPASSPRSQPLTTCSVASSGLVSWSTMSRALTSGCGLRRT